MKKLSCILLAVMLITAMFVSCTAEVIDDSNLVNVRFTTDDNAKGLNWSRPAFDSNDYFWTYSAKKVGGGPSTGEGTGDIGTDLTKEIGPFSQGAWEFTLYGYAKASDGTKTDVLVYEGTGSGVLSKDQDNSVKVAVEARKEGEGTIHISKDIVLKDSKGVTYIPTDIIIKQVGSETADDEIGFDSDKGNDIEKESGYYAVTIKMVATVNGKEITYSSNTIYVNVYAGQTTTIGGTLDESTTSTKFEAEDGTISKEVEDTINENGSVSLSVDIAPNSDENSTTTVEFSEGALQGGKSAKLSVVAYPASVVSKTFGVSQGDAAPISGIDFKLTVGGSEVNSFNGQTATITTFVAKNLTENTINSQDEAKNAGLKVIYNGSGDQPTITSYNPTDGKLVFTTTHFSQYYVASTRIVAVNENTNVAFGSLKDAVAAAESGDTITLLCDASGDGIGLYSNPKNGQTKTNDIIIDFNGFTYTINGELQGSTETVSQAFHLEKDCTVVLKNGKLTSNNAKMLIQNYCNLTLDGMELDFVESGRDYALSNNCGNVIIKDTTIKVAEGKVAFDVYGGFQSYGDVTVTVSGNSIIGGIVEVDRANNSSNDNKTKLIVESGSFYEINVKNDKNFTAEITGGTFSSEPSSEYVADGYVSIKGKNNYSVRKLADGERAVADYEALKKAVKEDGTIIITNDIVVDDTVAVVGKSVVLNMNGKTLSNTKDLWSETTGNWSLISVRGNGDLTITGNGTLKAKKKDCFTLDVQDGSSLTIENGTFKSNVHAVYVLKGNAEIKGGEYSIQQVYFQEENKDYEFVLNCYDANRKKGTASIIVSGGTFVNFNPANCQAEGDGTNFVKDGCTVTSKGKGEDTLYTVTVVK